jgi:hypothetical protein
MPRSTHKVCLDCGYDPCRCGHEQQLEASDYTERARFCERCSRHHEGFCQVDPEEVGV